MSEYSVGSGAGSVSSQIRCSHVPCGNFTTRPSALEPWTAHASCSRHTKCSRSRTCAICSCWPETNWLGFDNWMLRRKQRSQRDAANRARKAKARARERSESPPTLSPAHSERGRARTRRTATTKSGTTVTAGPATAGTATAGTAVTATAGTATAGTATAGTATTVSLSHSTTVASVLTGSSDGRSVTTLRRSPRKRTPVSPPRDNSPKKKKTKPASSSTTSSRKKGGADKASSKDLSQGPATRSGASRKKPSAAAGTAPADTATAGTAPTASTSASTSGSQALRPKTPTKAALKSYDHSFTLRDPLMPHLEDDPLGGDPFDAFDSGDEEIPCGQRDNLAAMFDLAGTLETPVPAQVGEPRAPPAPPLPPAAQTAPVAGPAPAIDLAMLVAALREAVPPPQPQAEVAQSLVAIGQALSALSTKMDTCQVLGKRARSRSPSPPSSPPPPREKRSRVRSCSRSRSRSRSYSPSPSRSGRSSPTSSLFSDQSEDESPPLGDEETLDLGIPP